MVKNCLPMQVDVKRPRFNLWVGKILRRRTWQPTPVYWPGKFHAQRSLAGYSPWGHQESDTTEATQHAIRIMLMKEASGFKRPGR